MKFVLENHMNIVLHQVNLKLKNVQKTTAQPPTDNPFITTMIM